MSGKVDPLTLEELISLNESVLTRNIEFEYIADGEAKKMEREVVFKRLTYEQIDALRKVPETEPLRYATAVIFAGSISPKFEKVDEVAKVPHGFVRHYSALILAESGKDPFLEKR